jgi:hypothetical protein
VSTQWLGVPFEYPVSTRYVLLYSKCAQHCPPIIRRIRPQAPEALSPQLWVPLFSTLVEYPRLSTL